MLLPPTATRAGWNSKCHCRQQKQQNTPACLREIQVHKHWTKVYSQKGLTATCLVALATSGASTKLPSASNYLPYTSKVVPTVARAVQQSSQQSCSEDLTNLQDIYSPVTLKCTPEFVLVTFHSYSAQIDKTLQLAIHNSYRFFFFPFNNVTNSLMQCKLPHTNTLSHTHTHTHTHTPVSYTHLTLPTSSTV